MSKKTNRNEEESETVGHPSKRNSTPAVKKRIVVNEPEEEQTSYPDIPDSPVSNVPEDTNIEEETPTPEWTVTITPWKGVGHLGKVKSLLYPGVDYQKMSPPIRLSACVLEGEGSESESGTKSFFATGAAYDDEAYAFMEDINEMSMSVLKEGLENRAVMANWKKKHSGQDALKSDSVKVVLPCRDKDGFMQLTMSRPVYISRRKSLPKEYNKIPWVDGNGESFEIDGVDVDSLPKDRVVCPVGSVIRAPVCFCAYFIDQSPENEACIGVQLKFLEEAQLCIQATEDSEKNGAAKARFPSFQGGTSVFK